MKEGVIASGGRSRGRTPPAGEAYLSVWKVGEGTFTRQHMEGKLCRGMGRCHSIEKGAPECLPFRGGWAIDWTGRQDRHVTAHPGWPGEWLGLP